MRSARRNDPSSPGPKISFHAEKITNGTARIPTAKGAQCRNRLTPKATIATNAQRDRNPIILLTYSLSSREGQK